MFTVMYQRKGYDTVEVTVYYIDSSGAIPLFLIYFNGHWRWVSAEETYPLVEDNK